MQPGRCCLAAVSLLVGVARVAGAGGLLDPSFGANGIVTLASGSWGDRFVGRGATRSLDPVNANAVVVVGVAPGTATLGTYGAAVAATGSLIGASNLGLDTELSNFGVFDRILADPTDPSHRIYAVGYQYTEGATPPYSFLVGRLSPLGDALDPTWGGGAPVITAVPGTTQATASVLEVQPDGKLLVAGRASAGLDDANDDVAIVRYDTDGTVDPAFGAAGATVIPSSIVRGIAVQSDGNILLAGFFTDGPFAGFGIVRLLPDGAIDPGFGAAFGAPGIATTAFRSRYTQGFATGVAVLPDGRIVAAGSDWDPYGRRGSFVAARYLADGTLDSTFSKRGKIRKRVGKSNVAGAIAFLPDGKVLIAGTARRKHPEHHTDIALLQLDANGKPDRSFGRGGKVQTPVVPDWEGFAVREALVDPIGRTTVVGVSADGTGKATILARYLP